MKVCPRCRSLAPYNSYFRTCVCTNCGWEDAKAPAAPPKKETRSIDDVLQSISDKELRDFMKRLYRSAIAAVQDKSPESLKTLRRVLLDWEYAPALESDPELASKLKAIREK